MAYIFTHGSGTEADPYLVETAEDLNGVRDYLSAHFKQVADIDLSGYANWEPINAFAGTYDGGGKKIESLTIVDQRVVPESPTPKWGAGLFGFLTTSTVKLLNINLNNVSITSEISNPKSASFCYYVGALVGGIELSSGTATITNCVAKNVTINVDGMNYLYGLGAVGGLLGYISRCNVTNCGAFKVQISHTFTASAQMGTGGFIGFMEASCILTQVAATGSMIGNAGRVDGGFFGGLVGYVRVTNLPPHKIYDSYAIVKITGGSNSTVGGFFGQECADGIYNDIRRCYAAGVLTGAVCKGLAGNSDSSLTDCFWDIEATGQSTSSSGTGLTTEQAKNQASYVNWDFETVWAMDPSINDGYPYLQGLQPPPVEVLPSYTPQSTIKLAFKAGDSAPYPMGIFYADKSVYKVGSAGTKMDGRNSIGKYLKDQSFDERCNYPSQAVSTMLEAMLAGAGLTKYYVQPSTVQIGMDFAPNKNILDGIEEILQYLPAWQMREEVDGTVVIGERTDSHFTQPSRYTFQRDRDIFSREVVTDDRSIYGRVCVHTEDFTVRVYRPVTSDLGWTPPAQKTLYQQVPEGTTSMEAATIANSLAASMANSGKVETFVCAFRPQIIPGDEAGILEADASKTMLGVITQVKHSFGVGGFYTEIVVDSGGRVGKPRFKDIVSAFTPPPATKKN